MEEKLELSMCPIRQMVSQFAGKWAMLTLHAVRERQPVRFSELGRLIPDVSTKMLSSTLRSLEADDLITRTVYPEVPPRVDYRLTPRGESLMPLLDNLTAWAEANLSPILRHRAAFARTEKGSPGMS